LFCGSETGGKIHRRGRFAHPTLLICDCYDSRHDLPL
jgi:hypothetical protein